MFNLFLQCQSNKNEVIKVQGKLEQIESLFKLEFQTIDDLQEFDIQLSELSEKKSHIETKFKKLNKELQDIEDILRDLREQKGNIQGILNRRSKLKGKTTVSYTHLTLPTN